MHIKRIHEMEEKLTEIALCEINKGIECVNTAEMGAVIDMIKDLACAEKDAREAKEMEKEEEDEKEEEKHMLRMLKEEHGMSEEDSRRFYDAWRYKNGRFAPKGRGTRRGYDEPPYYHMNPDDYKAHDAEWYRDMDRASRNVMYYTPMGVDTGTNTNTTTTTGNSGNVRGYSDGYAEGMKDGRKSGESRYDRARRGYEEKKEMHKGNTPEDKQAKMRELEKYTKELAEDVTEMISGATPEERNLLRQKMQMMIQKIPQ